MSSYEFWDELGKIFNAVVAYQEKNLEFNKRFISPWIRLGNVFEKQDRNKEAMTAYERAIEIDDANPQNWYELGNIHFKMENYADAVTAYRRAIELDASFGWAHNNLALTLATMGETEQAVSLYQTAIELLEDPKDKAVAWNRLGNAYRKMNEYERALDAFHRADELDRENSGFRDNMDEVTDSPALVEPPTEPVPELAAQSEIADSTESVAAASPSTDAQAPVADDTNLEPAAVEATQDAPPAEAPSVVAAPLADLVTPTESEAPAAAATAAETTNPEPASAASEIPQPVNPEATRAPALAEIADVQEAPVEPAPVEETVTVVVQDSTQTFTETLPLETPAPDAGNTVKAAEELPTPAAVETTEVVTSEDATAAPQPASESPVLGEATPETIEAPQPEAALPAAVAEPDPGEILDPAPNSLADQLLEAEPEVLDVAQQVAYEAFLKDTSEPLSGLGTETEDEAPVELPGSPEPVSKIDESGELQIEMDTKNAHVWNELGNVYFNTSAFDDAIVAYSKAIELDRWFAWPYSNLALAYVQKRRFVEAILLYQRSIELFSTDKDKAISWNRLGNVYRRLNDYENAIAAYQRADALDPDNSTLSLQSRFSLLGNYAMDQKPSYVS